MSLPYSALMLPTADGGQRFALHHSPAQPAAKAAVLYLHPFAEEMNKVRRMAALQSRALAKAGFAVLQIDLLGCGDSSGDLSDARWQDWVEDARIGARWLASQHGDIPLWLWGARAGCLLAGAAALKISPAPNLLFWAPTISGHAHLQQFLRIKVASEMLAGSAAHGAESPQQALAAGGTVEVAGYQVTAALAQGMIGARLVQPPASCKIVWLDVSNREAAALAPAATQWLEASRTAGCQVDARMVPGPAFWQTTEVEQAPALLEATLEALLAMSA